MLEYSYFETNPAKENNNADAFGESSKKMGW